MSTKKKFQFPQPLPILQFLRDEPPPLDFLWPGGPLAETVSTLVSPGGAGKSYFALAASMAVATGGAADPLRLTPQVGGRVVYLSLEDIAHVLHHRVSAIRKNSNLPWRIHERIAEQLDLVDALGAGFDLADPDCADALMERADGVRLLIIDTMRRAHSLDENSNGDMARVLGVLERVAARTGAAIMYLHHVSKNMYAAAEQQAAARGASVLVDNARWAGWVRKMEATEAERHSLQDRGPPVDPRFYVEWGVSKSNYTAIPKSQWLERGKGGALNHVELFPIVPKKKGGGDGDILGS